MKAILCLGAALLAGAAHAGSGTEGMRARGEVNVGDVSVLPAMFQQALAPLAPMSARVAREGLCPNLNIGPDGLTQTFDIEVKFKGRGVQNKRWDVTDLRILTPSGCDALDTEVAAQMRAAIPQFAEPLKDRDGNGWYKIPRIEIRLEP